MTWRVGGGLERNVSVTEVTLEVFLVVNSNPRVFSLVFLSDFFLAEPAKIGSGGCLLRKPKHSKEFLHLMQKVVSKMDFHDI